MDCRSISEREKNFYSYNELKTIRVTQDFTFLRREERGERISSKDDTQTNKICVYKTVSSLLIRLSIVVFR
jgi:hypothetical protein